MYKQFGKRLFDILFTVLALCIFAAIIGVIVLFVRVNLGRPIFFSQKRPGLNEKPFILLKFRTMTAAYDAQGNMRSDVERLTSFGRFLRTTSLDELPELFNVLRGEMSLVGPRPLLLEYLDRYTPEQARRHEVKPGITGWAQVNGRNAITWEKKFDYDVWYVNNYSLALDLKILWMTLLKVIIREDINHPGQATMPAFRGSDPRVSSYLLKLTSKGVIMPAKEIVIYGGGGFAREVAWLVESCNEPVKQYEIVCFVDDEESNQGIILNGISVLGLEQARRSFPQANIVGGVGSPQKRMRMMDKAQEAGFCFETIIHPRVERSKTIEIGIGAVICAGNILTVNITLGEHIQINLDCTIGHDVIMGDFTTLAPGVHVSGWVFFGKRVYVGTGAVIINGTKENPLIIGDDAIIGAGACVTKSVAPGTTVVGVPAKLLNRD